MMKIKYKILLACLFLSFCGCVEDGTVDDFEELNEVIIEGLEEKYSVLLYDYLNISLQLTTTHGDESNLSYLWYMYTLTSKDHADTLGKEKDLNIMLDPSFAKPGEDYTLAVKIMDKSTGVYHRETMKLEVLTQFSKGTVLLCKENGDAEVNFLTSGEERELIENIYSKANGGKVVGKNPSRIYSVNPSAYAAELKQELIFCNDENGGMITSPISFVSEKSVKAAFLNDFGSGSLNPELYFKSGFIDFIIINGQVCKRGVNMRSPDWESPLVSIQGSGIYDVAPFVMNVNSYSPIFYDRENKRLLQHYFWNKGGLYQFTNVENEESKFDCNAIGENMEMLSCGSLTQAQNFWMLMQNSQTKKIYLYKYKLEDRSFTGISRIEIRTQVAPNIYDADKFTASADYSGMLMYSVGQKVYSLTLEMLSETTASSLEVAQLDLNSRNMDVTNLKFVSISVGDAKIMQLRLSVIDNNRTDLKGGVMFYEVSSVGGVHSDLLFEKVGFCDEVVDIDEKYN